MSRDALPRNEPGPVTRVSRYELIREIGRGGYGIVYLATDTVLEREVAIKIARPEVVADPMGIERFRQEARAAATLEHPGIVPVFDCGNDRELHFYVMPFLDCDNLSTWIAKQTQPVDEHVAALIASDIAEAIHFGHSNGIIHRDLKPQNILLKPDPSHRNGFRPMILDFGLCGLVDATNTSTTMLAGTPRYMSPEQAMFGSCRITSRSDIYSLGVILFQLLTGRTPHQPESIPQAILMLHHESVRSPHHYRAGLSAAIDVICMKCLRRDAQRRYESAQLLAEDLQRFINDAPVIARAQSPWERIDFAIRFGEWETRLGLAVIAFNVTSLLWALAGALSIGYRFSDDPDVVAGFSQLLAFLLLVAFPVHCLGILSGWLMTKRTTNYKRLLVGTLLCAVWSIDLWLNFTRESLFLRIYEHQAYAQVMVFLLLGAGFTSQTICLAAGTWAAYRRSREISAESA